MERIEASSFQGPRAYFTNFDYRIVSRSEDTDALVREIERRIKVMLLTKGTIVCAASHLTSQFAFDLFQKHPILLTESLVIPALRRDKEDISAVFEGRVIPEEQKREMISFYNAHIDKVVTWDVSDDSTYFRDSFLQQLTDVNSILRTNLKKTHEKKINSVIKKIESTPTLGRDLIEGFAQSLRGSDKETVLNLRELLYHIFGAKSVNCESSLPQENYLDYSPSDLSSNRAILSDVHIFWKIFLELAFDSLHRPNLPMELMDLLSFKDIDYLRKPLLNGEFQKQYDQIINGAIQSIRANNPDKIIFNVQEIISIRETFVEVFDEIFEKEFEVFVNKKMSRIIDPKSLSKSGVSVGLGLAGFIPDPIISLSANTISVLLETPSFLVNLWSKIKNKSEKDKYQSYLQQREQALHSIVASSQISSKTPLLDAVDILSAALSEKICI